jgi:hypothetical protein
MNNLVIQVPEQALSDSKKNLDWAKKCIDAGENVLMFDSSVVRQTFYNKKVNYRLRNNMLTDKDIQSVCEPYGIEFTAFPKNMQHIGLGNSKVNTLVGEEAKRLSRYPFRAYISSSDQMGISSKEEQIKDMWYQKLVSIAQAKLQASFEGQQIDPQVMEEEMQKELSKFDKYLKYNYQDLKEITANKILKYEYKRLKVADIFLRSWEDFLISGEEVVCIEEAGDDIIFRKVNPLYLFTIQSPETYKIEDADWIVEYTMMSVGQVIDYFYNELTKEQIDMLEQSKEYNTMRTGGIQMAYNRDITVEERFGYTAGELFVPNQIATHYFGGAYDQRGNVRVMRVCWRSRRKIGKVSYYDEYGSPQLKIVDEYYKIDKDAGETVEWLWINEWWEGTKVANDIYVKIRPIPYQSRSMSNLSESKPPYVGVYCNTNNSRVMSFMDVMKPMDYLYDIFFHRLNLAISKYKGPMLGINVSMIPSEWDPLKWLQYAEATNIMFFDPTNEVLKGPMQGKSAGTYNQLSASAINLEMGNYINQHVQLLTFVKQQLDLISGVNEYRQGDIKGDSNVGTSNMGWTASNSMTEKYFALHNSFKRDCMQRLLEVAKYVWKKNPHKAQFVLDDMGAEIVNYYDEFSESEYDIHIDDGPNTQELMQALNQLAHAGMQTGQIKFRDLIEIYKKDSISALARYLEEAQDKITQEQQQMQQMQQESQERMAAQQAEIKAQELQLEMEKLNREDINRQLDRENKIQLETIRAMSYAQDQDINENMIPDILEQSKVALQQQKQVYEKVQKDKELQLKNQVENKKVEIEKQKLNVKEKEIQAKKEIEKLKAETALKVAKENKTKAELSRSRNK